MQALGPAQIGEQSLERRMRVLLKSGITSTHAHALLRGRRLRGSLRMNFASEHELAAGQCAVAAGRTLDEGFDKLVATVFVSSLFP